MKNFPGDGQLIDFRVTTDIVAGQAYYINDIVVVAAASGKSGTRVPMLTAGMVELPKKLGDVLSQGQLVYWDNANKWVTATASGNKRMGFTAEDAPSNDKTIVVYLYALS
jgi:predicted RecA/RadA family phage recombinase